MSANVEPARGRAVLVHARLEEPLSRWLWLVKWLLLIPHYIVLAFLYVAFAFVTLVAFFAILVTGRYPAALFAFNLGVLRWSWRVSYYGYSALGTDRYPPFSLGQEPEYPATLDIAYPARLSRGLVLVKWWLLALPHYLVLGFVVGGTSWTVTNATTGDRTTWTLATGSLLSLLVLFAGIGLLFTARYPGGLYDLAVGLDRWVLRVVAYVALMTDDYPPFRLDQGGPDPVEPVGPTPSRPGGTALVAPAGATPAPGPAGAGGRGGGAGAVVALVVGLLVALTGLGLTAAGGGGLWLESRRDAAGFVSTNTQLLSSPTAAITVESVDLQVSDGAARWISSDRFGTLRVRATGENGTPVFVGVAPQAAVDGWLASVAHDQITDIAGGTVRYQRHPGSPSATSPTAQAFWSGSVSGSGTQELQWLVRSGRWALVLARPDGAAGIQARTDVGAKIPSLGGLATGLLIGGLVLLAGGIALVVLGAAGLGRSTGRTGGGQGGPVPTPPSPRSPAAEQVPEPPATPAGRPTGE
jgi:Domain of unknown function (DUF4389)